MDDFSREAKTVNLSNATLDRLPAHMARPRYDRSGLTPGIVHIGLGNFHRAHQAWYLHRLMQDGLAMDWGIIGAGVRAGDAVMREKLKAQDCLTSLIELDPAGQRIEITGAMIDFLPVEEDNAALIRQMSDPAIRIVSLTVTEGGYYLDPTTGEFDATHDDILHDAASPRSPRTAFGAMVAALANRRAAGHAPFTPLSCDNLQGNGDILKRVVLGLADLSDPDLAHWIKTQARFPNSMVDCIVPATTPEVLAHARALGLEDAAPVTHENFRQWVIEDAFCDGRPPFEQAGVTITDDVHSYETMKLRILNGGHQLLANAGEILGVPTIADCMADPQISAFCNKVQREEIAPHVQAVPGMTAEAYIEQVSARFANPEIRDTTRRVAFDGSSRHAGFLLPTLRDRLHQGLDVEGLALAEALWARMCSGQREDGGDIAPNDPFWQDLTAKAQTARKTPVAWLDLPVYSEVAQDAAFAGHFVRWLERLWQEGCRETLAAYCAG